ncbi:MAG TPA: endo-1,3-alpha-glucanase family glycosylhydrolase [Acidobacteriaceae bacterium]|nr:endo-1,3-alpha-glucanase family glycosylhydrolase [Acidobacteriaceae bacterium]
MLLLPAGCRSVRLKYTATGGSPELLAVYEGWFGMPNHVRVSYSSHDPAMVDNQVRKAKGMGLTGFVMDWYGDREPWIDQSYALLQKTAAQHNFHAAMMYDETEQETGATDETITDLTTFRDHYLAPTAPGHEAYLTYQGRPVIFVFSHGGYTDWDEVRKALDKWNPAPFLIEENVPRKYPNAFDGSFAWINPGPDGWAADGSHWGKGYLADFYRTMVQKYPDKIVIGGAWSQFGDMKASWSLNRHISARCGQTLHDTFNLWREFVPRDQTIPFLLIETWNDYEEGTALEPGLPECKGTPSPASLEQESGTVAGQ